MLKYQVKAVYFIPYWKCVIFFLGSENMTIKGKIMFGGFKRVLPTPSCLVVVLEDVSLMDAPSMMIGSKIVNLSAYDTIKPFEYLLELKKPIENQLWPMTKATFPKFKP